MPFSKAACANVAGPSTVFPSSSGPLNSIYSSKEEEKKLSSFAYQLAE